jgi:hypothetical protein
MDKLLHNLQLLIISTFESARVVEDITVMTGESQFVPDVMFPTLYKHDPHDQPSPRRINGLYLLASTELLNLVI